MSVCAVAGLPVCFRAVRFWSVVLVVGAVAATTPAYGGTGRLVRTSLDESHAVVAPPNEARVIRNTLDDPSHRQFPLEDSGVRLIRVSLDETNAYAPLQPAARRERQLRTSLD